MTPTQQQKTPQSWLFAALVVVGALVLGMLVQPAVARAQDPVPDDVLVLGFIGSATYFIGPSGYFYGSEDSPYTATTGNPIASVCTEDPPDTVGVATRNDDGTWTSRVPGSLFVPIYIYENPTDDFTETFPTICTAIEAGDEPPEPFAIGWGALTARVTKDSPFWSYEGPQPAGHYVNEIQGWAWHSDGTRHVISGRADYVASAEGPPEFDELTLEVEPVEARQAN